jgi:hypothetical protein
MPKLHPQLVLERCPHCAVANPNLRMQYQLETRDHTGEIHRLWYVYVCSNCGGVVTAWALKPGLEVVEIFPCPTQVSEDILKTPKAYLLQAIASVHAPAGAVMLAASAVDSMLKEINYKKGSLYDRIEQAVKDNLITSEMARWAHDVRLDANDQRHADETVGLPNTEDAKRVIDFATAFAEYLFVLPAKIKRGLRLQKKE